MEDNSEAVPAAEFTRNFGRYRMQAQREAVAVSSHGRITGYFVGPEEYEEFKRFRKSRRSFATAELSRNRSRRSADRAWMRGTPGSTSCSTPNSGGACRSPLRSRAS